MNKVLLEFDTTDLVPEIGERFALPNKDLAEVTEISEPIPSGVLLFDGIPTLDIPDIKPSTILVTYKVVQRWDGSKIPVFEGTLNAAAEQGFIVDAGNKGWCQVNHQLENGDWVSIEDFHQPSGKWECWDLQGGMKRLELDADTAIVSVVKI